MQRRTIDIRDAARQQGPLSFQIMVKPAGGTCNLACDYCYYTGKAEAPGGSVMSDALLEKVVKDGIETNAGQEVTFTWHGGEPLLAGHSFFEKAIALQRRYASGKRIVNTLQTNGTLLTPRWASFFRQHDFLVGLSLDGPADVHDGFRRDRGGHPTFLRVMRGLSLLRDAGVAFNTLTTVNARSQGRGREIYAFLREAGSRYLQFLPVSEPADPPYNVSAAGFGRFLCDVFDQWVRNDVGETFVGQFDAALCCWCGLPPGTCVHARTCTDTLTVERDGSVYACDHFVDEAHRLGHLATDSFRQIMAQPRRMAFVMEKYTGLPPTCLACPWLPACCGECPQHRAAAGTQKGRNRLCEGYRLFFEHAAPCFDRMRLLLDAGRAPADIMRER